MSSSHRLDLSPGPQIRDTPGAFPSSPGEVESPTAVSSQRTLSQAVFERRAEYTVSKKIKIKVGTWNVAALSGTEKDVGGWFVGGKGISESLSVLSLREKDGAADTESLENVEQQEARRSKKEPTIPINESVLLPGGEEIGLYVLGLQEIVDISSATEALRPYNDPHPGRKWKRAVEAALPNGYVLVVEQQLIGLYLLVYAAPSISPTVSSVSTTSVRTGLMGYMGNKGAVVARIILGETTRFVFINCHLCAGVEKGNLERRNWDASQVQKQTRFDPVYIDDIDTEEVREGIGDEDFAFWLGDLNYRLDDLPGEDVRRLLMLHTRNEYSQTNTSKRKINAELVLHDNVSGGESTRDDTASHTSSSTDAASSTDTASTLRSSETLDPSSDPSSLHTTLASLLAHDQLRQQMRERKAFHDGWREGPIDFLPTYKYDVGSVGMFDSSEKKRGPSWCDRILFRTRRDKLEYDHKIRAEEAAKKRDQEMKAHGMDEPNINEEEILFDYDPATDGADDEYDPDADHEDPEAVMTKAGFEDKIHLDYYTSHQRVLSSDHKPLDAIFTVTYEAVDPDLKSKIHQEVARKLDKAENEARPAVTVIVDPHQESHGGTHPFTDHESVDFGSVHFASTKTRNITIANTGPVPASLEFTDRIVSSGQAAGAAPPWLRIQFDWVKDRSPNNAESHDVYTLEPGDAANVELTVYISDIDLVRALNEGHASLEDVLILRVHNGRDYFLPVHATWSPSSFGRSIGNLIRVPETGIRKSHDQSGDGPGREDTEGVKWSAPREIFRLTEAVGYLVERAVADLAMRSVNERPPWEDVAWPFIVPTENTGQLDKLEDRIREALDNNTSISETFEMETALVERAEAVARTLLALLASLEDGVITHALWTELEHDIKGREKSKQHLSAEEEKVKILDVLISSPAHSTSFTFLMSMLIKVINEIISATTVKGRTHSLRKDLETGYASAFSEAIIRAPFPANTKERRASQGRRNRLIQIFIQVEQG
ncbi:MAG: hypothetical protein Q9201_000581 [Fulgogasparrea decipioides]